MSFSDIEHFTSVFAGCESLLAGDSTAPDAKYAFTVLQLHANDHGFVAGQEGFMDAIKKGAASTVKWIKSIIRAIQDYLKGISREDRARINKINEMIKELKTDDYDPKDAYDAMIPPTLVIKKKLEGINDYAKELDVDLPSIEGCIKKADDALKYMEGDKEFGLYKELDALLSEVKNTLTRVNSTLEKIVSGKKDTDSLEADDKKAAKVATDLAATVELIVKLMERWGVQVTDHYSNWERRNKADTDRREDLEDEKDRLEKKK
ncbi:hypothetical protein D5W64_13075 [Salmonella enterica subsp. enterica serovar Saintpaul]|nr:hypothetical protein [Salmonella enterica subsp. enterica serovar Saintpaul]